MTVEAWSDIDNTEYCVSDEGRIASRKFGKWRIMKPWVATNGYLLVEIHAGESRTAARVHRMVAERFIGPAPTPAHEINHKDGDKTNNRAANLEWVTRSQNQIHAHHVLGCAVPTTQRGASQWMAKLTDEKIREIRKRREGGEFLKDIAADYGVSMGHVGLICQRKTWAHVSCLTPVYEPVFAEIASQAGQAGNKAGRGRGRK